jgi:O-antigen ligase
VLAIPVSKLMQLSGSLSRSGDPTELLTFTGRTEIWSFAWDKILDNPWVGYGYNSSKFILPQFAGLPGLVIDEAHNMLLQNLLGVGVIGTVPLLCLFLTLIAAYLRRLEATRDGFTFLNLIWGITVAGSFGSTPTVMSLATFCGLALAAQPAFSFGASQKNSFTPPLVAGAS